MDSDTTARGLLMLRLILTTTEDTDSDTMDLDTPDTSDTDSDIMDSDTVHTTARGLLMLSLRLRLILTTTEDMDSDTPDTDSDTMDLDTPDTSDTESITESKLYQDHSVNQQLELGQKWIVISLNFPSPVLQFQCYHTKSLVMVSRKQENQSGKNPTNIKI